MGVGQWPSPRKQAAFVSSTHWTDRLAAITQRVVCVVRRVSWHQLTSLTLTAEQQQANDKGHVCPNLKRRTGGFPRIQRPGPRGGVRDSSLPRLQHPGPREGVRDSSFPRLQHPGPREGVRDSSFPSLESNGQDLERESEIAPCLDYCTQDLEKVLDSPLMKLFTLQ